MAEDSQTYNHHHTSTLLIVAACIGSMTLAGLAAAFCLNAYWKRQAEKTVRGGSVHGHQDGGIELGARGNGNNNSSSSNNNNATAPDTQQGWREGMGKYFGIESIGGAPFSHARPA